MYSNIFTELAERMFNFVYENYLMWIKVTKYIENLLYLINGFNQNKPC